MPKQVGNVQLMQKMNRLRVLNHIRRNPDISRPLIAEHTGLSLASITNVTSYLLEIGLLAESGIELAERVGRKSTLLRFRSEAYGFIIASLSEDIADIFYTDMEGNIDFSKRISVYGMSCDDVISVVRQNVCDLLEQYGKGHTLAIGINFSGLVLDGNRFVLSSSMKWKEIDIKKLFEDATGLPVFVENISRLRAVWYSSSHKHTYNRNVVFVDLQNGIGAVEVSDGIVSNSVLGEIGHTTVERNGIPCFCGNRGCLEAMCSAERVLKLYEHKSGKTGTVLSDVYTLYEIGDPFACEAIKECGEYLGIGLSNLISMFHPSELVINCGQFEDCPSVISEAVAEMSSRVYPALLQDLATNYITIDLEETISGAAFAMCDRLFDVASPENPVE